MHRVLAAALTTGALLWTAALFLAPMALTRRTPSLEAAAGFVYQAAGLVCHQRPERSFHIRGVQQPVCARCLGLYLSGTAAALVAWLAGVRAQSTRRARVVFAIVASPTAVTLIVELLGIAHPSNTIRALSALPLGAAAGWIFVQSLRAESVAATPTPYRSRA
jgi:uncharacterized membrane protein